MAVIYFLFGAIIGLLSATVGWLFFGLSIAMAFAVYIGIGLTVGLAMTVSAMMADAASCQTRKAQV